MARHTFALAPLSPSLAVIVAALALLTPSLATAEEVAASPAASSWSASPDPASVEHGDDGNDNLLDNEKFQLKLATEIGLLSVMYNNIQQGSDGTEFDFVNEGGQELFVPFLRASGELLFNKRHTVILLYQPIDTRTRVRLRRDVDVNDLTFAEGTSMDLRYGFDFYRATYMYDVFKSDDVELSLGGGFQMRVAAISFFPVDGSEGRNSRDLGVVPLLKVRARKNLSSGWWYGAEIDGFYARVKVLNGDLEAEVTGGIYDASLRAGRKLGPGLDGFVNVRFLGGGAEGTSPQQARDEPGDGYVANWLHAASISLGFYFQPAVLTD